MENREVPILIRFNEHTDYMALDEVFRALGYAEAKVNDPRLAQDFNLLYCMIEEKAIEKNLNTFVGNHLTNIVRLEPFNVQNIKFRKLKNAKIKGGNPITIMLVGENPKNNTYKGITSTGCVVYAKNNFVHRDNDLPALINSKDNTVDYEKFYYYKNGNRYYPENNLNSSISTTGVDEFIYTAPELLLNNEIIPSMADLEHLLERLKSMSKDLSYPVEVNIQKHK